MSNYEFRKTIPEDIFNLRPQESQFFDYGELMACELEAPGYLAAMCTDGNYSLLRAGTILAIFGVVPIQPFVGRVWALTDVRATVRDKVWFQKPFKEWLDNLPFDRVESIVFGVDTTNSNYTRRLGFTREAVMLDYCGKNKHAELYRYGVHASCCGRI